MNLHEPVLLQEITMYLDPQAGETIIDATCGAGGHSLALCQKIGESGHLIGCDLDKEAVLSAKERLKMCPCKITLVVENYKNVDTVLSSLNIKQIDKALFDLGMSSLQLHDAKRGFSFLKEGPLDMAFAGITRNAFTIVNGWDEESLAHIFKIYGEERFSKSIARSILKQRKNDPIKTTTELVDVIWRSVPAWYRKGRLHPATKTFQAIRIAANDELENIKNALPSFWKYIRGGGRVAVISFHSIEDRIVKEQFRKWKEAGEGTILTKKPITPTSLEIEANPRARSAKLRVIQKIQ